MAVDWREAASLPSPALQQLLLDESGALFAGLSKDEEDRVLAALPAPLRTMWLLNWLDFEVAQGSLLAYFYNSHGRHSALAAGALTAIGAHRMAAVVVLAAAAARRNDAKTQRELERLTDNYWKAADEDGWGDRLDVYLAAEVKRLATK